MASEHTPAIDVSGLACEVQYLIRRIEHLCAAIDDASDELEIRDEQTRTAVDRVQVFVDLIRQAAVEAGNKAEDIERGHVRARKAA